MRRFPVTYLTGAPATGKSTLSRNLATRLPSLLVFAYSEELRKFVERNRAQHLTEDSIRELSSRVITAEDVAQLDRELVELVARERGQRPIVVDSHAVTKESYGFRVTGFDIDTLRALNPDTIVCLYTAPDVTIDRIKRNPMGRPTVTEFETQMHVLLQSAVATQYGVLTGKPVYLVDSACSENELVAIVMDKAKLA